ncbi:MAG: hypothetical protein M0R06_02595 [Sphaerochaeta sp.]|jgi:hypothetical protein|nr:hypothetical protein [Sphaerochaeta sp.]
MSEIKVKVKESWKIEKYRNEEIIEWVSKEFETDAERIAAFAMFAHICNKYPYAAEYLRGRLVESEEIQGEE